MLFVERPGLADFVRARELGAAVKVHTPLEHYSAEVGAFNGMGENTTREDAEGFPLLSFRVEAMPLAVLEGGEGDVARSPEPALALGAHVAYTQDALADDEEPSLTRIDGARLQYGGDIAFKWAGFYFGGEFVGAWYRPDAGAEWFGAGWLLQSSYYVAPIRCEAAVRYDELNPSDQLDDDRERTLSFGLNAYPFESQSFKLQASYALAFEGRDDDLTFLVQLAYP